MANFRKGTFFHISIGCSLLSLVLGLVYAANRVGNQTAHASLVATCNYPEPTEKELLDRGFTKDQIKSLNLPQQH